MSDPLMLVLRLLHIGAGVLWVGAAWMLYLFVTPTLRAMGPQTEREFTTYILRKQKLALTILLATVVTTGAGLAMLAIDISRMGAQLWFSTGFGIGITIGAAAAIGSFLLGPALIIPISNKLEKASAPDSTAPQSERDALATRLRNVLAVDSALLVVAVLFMAIARYL